MADRKLLITGATGKQGGAVIDALISRSAPFQILALTRNASSVKAKSLASKPSVTVVEGDYASASRIFSNHGPIYGVFLVTTMGKAGEEEAQATPIITEAAKAGVEHVVFTSVDRGGAGKSEVNPTNVPHFASKHRIETLLKEKAAEAKMKWTILRPVGFMDNYTPGFIGRAAATLWASLGDTPMQVISVHDIGVFGARAFLDPDAYNGRAIALAGDVLTFEQGEKVFKESLGYEMPKTYGFVGSAIKYMVKDVGIMFAWFKSDGYGADIPALRKEEPELQDFGTWLKETSQFKEK